MNKPNNIQDRIKLLMEYDTSKTYSENKELINEISIPSAWKTWIVKAADYILKILRVKKGPEALKQIKDKLIKPFKFKYENPEKLVNSIKGENKIRYKELLDDIKSLETKIENQQKNNVVSVNPASFNAIDINNLLNYKKDLYTIYFEEMQKEFKKNKDMALLFTDNSLNILNNNIKSTRNITDLDNLFISYRDGFFREYENIKPNLFFQYLFEITTGRITPATWIGYGIAYIISDYNLGSKPYTKEETIKTICGDYARTCKNPNKINQILEALAKSANSKAKLFILSAVIYGLFKKVQKVYRRKKEINFLIFHEYRDIIFYIKNLKGKGQHGKEKEGKEKNGASYFLAHTREAYEI
jgi:hypothetical protein